MFFPFGDTTEAMSHTSPRSCELSRCVIARDGTWIDISAILAEEETMSEAVALIFFSIVLAFDTAPSGQASGKATTG
ncbi:hypothetical protein SAMN05421736_111124 [Evansella caseinilytica]|uniref:Uncharacterized protein n=1 Tax=Evansella caseinilytica TaxID=1503961 RepID=A0A1H3SNR8_9BACI|nr:hypothetical protein [Evansella caseinilytica]SDZ39181.1 hypothetical protein SAMN05421736_111124 [Evansella caseinilytica]